ncbi:MAG TPA: phospholipid carrier-dependent glycosyltransferase [Candidatus Limnocylindria bacterium]|nr:phospholipid carrier-dependent glycosyltransferase [Candidatus Limnocylindria bacterium]
MTRDPVGRRGAWIADSIRRLDVGTILAAILVLGLVLRVFIAGVYLPLSGFAIDIGDFSAWGQRLASVGPAHFYEAGYFSDYPPGYLYVLWLLGTVGHLLEPIVGRDATGGLVKIPGIAADIGVAWLLFVMARRWGGELVSRTRFDIAPETLGLTAAAAYLFNPGVVFDSAVWGQVDSVGSLVLLATIYALGRGWTEVAALGAVVGMLVKFQFAFLIPIVAIVGIKRHLLGRSSDPQHAGHRDALRVLTSLAVGIVSVTVLMLPFGMFLYAPLAGGDPRGLLGILPQADPSTSLIGKLVEAAGTYTGLSINAMNMWRNPWSGLGDTLTWGDDTTTAFLLGSASVTWQQIGVVLFAAAATVALWIVARRDEMRGLLLASLILAIAFFALPTRVHERYLFPALAIGALLIFSGRAWPWIYAALSLSFFANVYWVYTEDWSFAERIMNPGLNGQPMAQDAFLQSTLFTDGGIWLLALMITVTFAAVIWLPVRWSLTAPAPEPSAVEPAPAPPAAVDDSDRPPARRRGWLTPNPADVYFKEPMRRLDRRDALIALGLVLFALVFRLWRLDLPRSMHFDEVYHARSAAEFLSNWENGYDRDVYEWTHPMLAKYLIAAGIVAVDPNKVVGTLDLPGPATTLAVAPARASVGHGRSVAFIGDGTTLIVAADAESGDEIARWDAGGPVAALAYDEAAGRLLVGLADRGEVQTYELAALLASPDGRAPPAGTTIDSGLLTVAQILVPADSTDPLLLRGTGGVALVDGATGELKGTLPGIFGGVGLVHGADGDDPDWVVVTEADTSVVRLFDASTFAPKDDDGIAVDAPLIGPLLVRGTGDDQLVVALTGGLPANAEHPATQGGVAVVDGDEAAGTCVNTTCLLGLVPLPGAPALIGEQRVAGLIQVAGTTAAGAGEVWTIEPHIERRDDTTIGMAAFDATALPGQPLAMAYDIASTSQGDDHGRLLVSAAGSGGASIAAIDVGSNAFAWRISGVVFGSILVGLIYLLTATMFGRRRIAILAAAFVALDGMSFVMSRISMNDIFVATFIVAAYLLFWQVWSGRWNRSAWWAMPLVGVLIGLASASKWVGFYALAGLFVLVLARSSLGRLVLVAMVALLTAIGAIGAPWPFLIVMLGLLAIALAITWVRPIGIDVGEAMSALPATAAVLTGIGLAFVIGYGQVEGGREPGSAIEYLFGLLARGAQVGWPVWLMIGVAGVLVAWRAALSLLRPESDARWFRPGEMGGFAWSWAGACLIIIPLVVYGLMYIPYLQLGHDWAIGGGPGYGWSLDELHAQMFGYHFNLKAGHDSAAPWWSWPLMLKPTWFYNGTFDSNQIAVIYNGGNPILFWAGVPAIVACAVLAWTRRSLGLVLIVAAFAFQFVPWIRIERATFAYHYLTAVLFAMIAVAYVVDELLRRPAWRDIAIGYLALAVFVGLLIFPLGSALPMPDWYINAARALPPWNFGFQFPDPPQGTREELLSVGALKGLLGLIVMAGAVVFAIAGRGWWERRSPPGGVGPSPMPEGGSGP